MFGAYLLAPMKILEYEFNQNLHYIKPSIEEAKALGIDKVDYEPYALDKMASILAPKFEISHSSMMWRIRNDNLLKDLP